MRRVAEQPLRDSARPSDADQRGDPRREAVRSGRGGSAAPSRSAAIGGTRVARSAGARPPASVHDARRHSADDDGARLERQAGRAAGRSRRVEQRRSALRDQEAADEPDQRRREPDHERLAEHARQHLAAGRAERAQQRELARALGDRDRERVEDDERADEQRDAAEREQRRARGTR